MSEAPEFLAPPLPVDKAHFLTQGLTSVQGYLNPSTALYLSAIEFAQRDRVAGGICEIGVHRGKSFLAMTIGLAEGDAAVAIDIFDAQHLNMEATSQNALRDFKNYAEKWGMTGRIDIIEGSSLELEAEGFFEAGKRFRLFSVDGGHLDYHVLNDLRVAEATLSPGGIVAADDLLNAHYLGVITGVFQYLLSGGALVPFALVPNKLLLTDAASVESNKAMMRDLFGAGLSKGDVPFHNVTIDVYGDHRWTVVDTDGHAAPLQREPSTVAEFKKVADDLREQVAALNTDKRELSIRLTRARERAARQRARADALEAAQSPRGRADVLPTFLRKPARAAYRVVRKG